VSVKQSNILVTSDGTACLGEFSDEHIPSEQTIALYGGYIAPELVDIERLHKLGIDNYRSIDYEGEYKMESDIFALGCCMIEVYRGIRLALDSGTTDHDIPADIYWSATRQAAYSI